MILGSLAPLASAQVPPLNPPAPYPQDKVLNNLVATHPYGVPGSLVCTGDGHWLLVAEGGSVAFIEAGSADPQSDPPVEPFATPAKRPPVGLMAPLPVEMMLDPDAVLPPLLADPNTPTHANLFIAGGRLGLWIMGADPRPGQPNPASRIDNSGSGNQPLSQDSRRWCSDLGLLTVGPRRYVVALFSALGHNRLRIYDLDDARAVLGAETGNELQPLRNISLNEHPDWQPAVHAEDYGLHKSFAYAIAVDGHDIYVAMGSHGLVRVRLGVDVQTGEITGVTKAGGPVLGTGSVLHGNSGQDPIGHYADYEYRDTSGGLRRRHGPLFTDVKVYSDGQGAHKLFAGVDHLGWMRFDLTSTWQEGLAPEHHEGVIFLNPSDNPQVSLVTEDEVPQATYVRKLALVDTGSRLLLGVAASRESIVIEPAWRSEGWMLNYLTFKNYIGDVHFGNRDYTIVYEDPHSSQYAFLQENHLGWGHYGGDRVALPTQGQSTVSEDPILVFGGHQTHSPSSLLEVPETSSLDDDSHATVLATVTGPGTRTGFHARYARHRPGRYTHTLGYSIAAPQVLHLPYNDAGLVPDGALIHCGDTIVNNYAPPAGFGPDPIGSYGVVVNQGGQWLDSQSPYRTFVAGFEAAPVLGDSLWMVTWFDVGQNWCGPQTPVWPQTLNRVFFERMKDRFDATPRHYYGFGAAVDLDEDLLLFTQIKTPEGLVVLDRAMIEGVARDLTLHDALHDITELPPLQGNAHIATFDTHPEFSEIEAADTTMGATKDALKNS